MSGGASAEPKGETLRASKRGCAHVVFPNPRISDDDPALLAFIDDLAAYFADRYLAGQLPKEGPGT
jgi:hypothetical protein